MFKSCFPNSRLRDDGAPVPAIADNPMKGLAVGGPDCWDAYTVANAKGIYLDLLPYFGAHPEKLFVAVVAPPVRHRDTPGGRALANWLVDHWLQDSGYSAGNVLVFDLYNVLSSKTGSGGSDVGLESGNHHRVWNGAVQHKTDDGADRLAYPRARRRRPPERRRRAEGDGRVRAAAQRRLQRLEGQRGRRTAIGGSREPVRSVPASGLRVALRHLPTMSQRADCQGAELLRTESGIHRAAFEPWPPGLRGWPACTPASLRQIGATEYPHRRKTSRPAGSWPGRDQQCPKFPRALLMETARRS